MKFNLRKLFTGLQLVGLTIGLLAGLALPQAVRADQQGYPSTTGSLTNLPAAMGTNYSSSATNNYIPLRSYSGLGLQANSGGAASMTVYPSVDGTNALAWSLGTISGTGYIGTNYSVAALRGLNGVFVSYTNTAGASNTLTTFWTRPNQP